MARLVSAGATDPGNVRGNNEDRYYIDDERGIYLVVDGMGGQAAGEEAAEIAVRTVRGRLERATEGSEQRVREAIALANNAIFEAASKNPEWHGMACVLTLALVEDGHATVGHVGDSRAYQIRAGKIEKITRDHSPVGEREDSGELSEEAAMKHPRRNEVYRDVGSMPRTPDDADFIDVRKIRIPPDSALLLCSDGLSDVVPSRRILQVIEEHADNAQAAVTILLKAAVADGKDNVSVVLVEGETFAASVVPEPDTATAELPRKQRSAILPFVAGLVMGLAVAAGIWFWPKPVPKPVHVSKTIHVAPQGAEYSSIPEAINFAAEGDAIELAPGVYPDRILLKSGIAIRSARRHEAILSGGVVADAVTNTSIEGVKIRDGAVEIRNSDLRLDGLDIQTSILWNGSSTGCLRGSRVAGKVSVEEAAAPAIEFNFISGNITYDSSADCTLTGNAITGTITIADPPAELLKQNAVSGGKKAVHEPR
jgi:serine/threonine protein phosphatase PrpC